MPRVGGGGVVAGCWISKPAFLSNAAVLRPIPPKLGVYSRMALFLFYAASKVVSSRDFSFYTCAHFGYLPGAIFGNKITICLFLKKKTVVIWSRGVHEPSKYLVKTWLFACQNEYLRGWHISRRRHSGVSNTHAHSVHRPGALILGRISGRSLPSNRSIETILSKIRLSEKTSKPLKLLN